MTQEALKDLLDAVEAAIQAGDWKVDGACDPDLVIRQAKEALAQPEQEPVAIVAVDGVGQIQVGWITKPQHNDKLYTTPPQRPWVGLTFAEICECESEYANVFARNLEAKLKEKNT